MRFFLTGCLFLFVVFSCGRVGDEVISKNETMQSYSLLKGIPPAKDFNLSSSVVGSATLSSLFTGHNMVIDLSASACGACFALASNLKYDKEAQKWFNGEHCNFVTIVDELDYDKWIKRIGSNSYSAQHSYGVNEGIGSVEHAYGINAEFLPAIMIIDRDGKVVAYSESDLPAETGTICGE